jgi:hypothetical protein
MGRGAVELVASFSSWRPQSRAAGSIESGLLGGGSRRDFLRKHGAACGFKKKKEAQTKPQFRLKICASSPLVPQFHVSRRDHRARSRRAVPRYLLCVPRPLVMERDLSGAEGSSAEEIPEARARCSLYLELLHNIEH